MITFIFGLLTSLLIPVILIYSLINPKRFNIRTKNNHDGKWSRKNFYFAVLVAWIVSIIVLGTIAPDTDESSDTNSAAEVELNNPIASNNEEIELDTDIYSPSLSDAELGITNTFDNNEITIYRSSFSGSWPFYTQQGIIGCKDNAIYFISGNHTYALTGFSRSYSDQKGLGWKPLTPQESFWLANPDIPGTKISVSDVISAGEKLCN